MKKIFTTLIMEDDQYCVVDIVVDDYGNIASGTSSGGTAPKVS
jgi:isoaspartyl peptidase/L-asparaginase-like protein (Ntn-hydrolase superfamily)